jgi:hypothetical protein
MTSASGTSTVRTGTNGYCDQGTTYRGSRNAACGGHSNWAHTDLEVWRPL